MTDPGLNDRLRQKSRRAGLAVGLSMALAIAISIGGATLIYAALIEPLSDLIPISRESRAPVQDQIQPLAPVDDQQAQGLGGAEPAQITEPEAASIQQASAPVDSEPTTARAGESPTTSVDAPAKESAQFKPTHQIGASQSVNFRAGPTRGDAIIVALPPSTPIQYLDEDAPTEDPADGDRWMKFVTEDGQEGWVREIDVVSYQP
ncbi:MAG: SH3 domain-containing protein [Thermomicrobiales bacterium]